MIYAVRLLQLHKANAMQSHTVQVSKSRVLFWSSIVKSIKRPENNNVLSFMLYMWNSGQVFSKIMITEKKPPSSVSGVHYFNTNKWVAGSQSYLCPPHQPQLEDINVPSTLQSLVSCVVRQVVVLVLLKEIGSMHLIATLHQSLMDTKTQAQSRQHRFDYCFEGCFGWKITNTQIQSNICASAKGRLKKKDKTRLSCSVD